MQLARGPATLVDLSFVELEATRSPFQPQQTLTVSRRMLLAVALVGSLLVTLTSIVFWARHRAAASAARHRAAAVPPSTPPAGEHAHVHSEVLGLPIAPPVMGFPVLGLPGGGGGVVWGWQPPAAAAAALSRSSRSSSDSGAPAPPFGAAAAAAVHEAVVPEHAGPPHGPAAIGAADAEAQQAAARSPRRQRSRSALRCRLTAPHPAHWNQPLWGAHPPFSRLRVRRRGRCWHQAWA